MARIRAPFMTDAMWLFWLLDSDVRGHAGVGNMEAQREFAAWWILHGGRRCPKVWTLSSELVEVACEPRIFLANVSLPRILAVIYESRDDLQKAFPIPPRRNIVRLCEWYGKFAAEEYCYAPQLPGWFLQQHAAKGVRSKRQAEPIRASVGERVGATCVDQFSMSGVNLVGYPRGEFGIGEDLRMMSAALESAKVPHAIFDIKNGSNARQNDRTCERRITELLPYHISIFCTSAFDTARIYLEDGERLFAGRYNIGYWPWELGRFPPEWECVFDLVDEVWAASTFTAEAYGSRVGSRAKFVPPAVAATRKQLKVTQRTVYRFLCPFDPNSSIERKNPAAAVAAFFKAFPPAIRDVRLLFAVNGALPEHPQAQVLRDASLSDPRVEIREGTLDKVDYHMLIENSDCLVSPHRAEGFGRNIAEAKVLGIAVLATGYSGSSDFLEPEEQVEWNWLSVSKGDYPYGVGLPWADIRIDELAKKMRRLYEDRISVAAAPLPGTYLIPAAGERFKAVLREVSVRDDVEKVKNVEFGRGEAASPAG